MKIQIFCEVVQNFPRSPSENVPYHLQFFTANLGLCLVELLVQVSFGIFFFTTKRKMANSNETYHQLPCKQRSLQSHRVTTSMHICSLLRLQRCFGVSRNAPPKKLRGSIARHPKKWLRRRQAYLLLFFAGPALLIVYGDTGYTSSRELMSNIK